MIEGYNAQLLRYGMGVMNLWLVLVLQEYWMIIFSILFLGKALYFDLINTKWKKIN